MILRTAVDLLDPALDRELSPSGGDRGPRPPPPTRLHILLGLPCEDVSFTPLPCCVWKHGIEHLPPTRPFASATICPRAFSPLLPSRKPASDDHQPCCSSVRSTLATSQPAPPFLLRLSLGPSLRPFSSLSRKERGPSLFLFPSPARRLYPLSRLPSCFTLHLLAQNHSAFPPSSNLQSIQMSAPRTPTRRRSLELAASSPSSVIASGSSSSHHRPSVSASSAGESWSSHPPSSMPSAFPTALPQRSSVNEETSGSRFSDLLKSPGKRKAKDYGDR